MRQSRTWACVGLVLCAGLVYPRTALALTETEVAEWLLCYACPGEPLTADRCRGGDEMRAAIRQMISQGKSREEILRYFVDRFGEEILAVPPQRGFNLVAYVGPFLGLLLGGVLAVLVVRRWSAAGGRRATAAAGGGGSPAPLPPLDDKTRRQIEQELAQMEQEG